MEKANLKILHPSADGKGSGIRLEFHFQTNDSDGFIMLTFADQDGVNYDFESGIKCKLKFDEVSKVIDVLSGNSPSFEDGKPIRVGDDSYLAMKYIEDSKSFLFAGCRKSVSKSVTSQITLKRYEANGVLFALKESMFYLSFIKGVNP